MVVVLFGCGVMGQILLQRLLKSGEEITVVDLPPVIERLKMTNHPSDKLTFSSDGRAVMGEHPTATVVLAVKPYQVSGVLEYCRESALILTIVAGRDIQSYGHPCVVRLMTNVSARLHAAPIILCSPNVDLLHQATLLMQHVGEVMLLEEEGKFDAVTALIGSSPAVALETIEGLALGGVRLGLTRTVALRLAAYSLLGAAKLVLGEKGECSGSPTELRDQICTPGGCTIAGIESLEQDAYRGSLMRALQAINNKLQ